jgi:hypothetical protein
MANPISKNLCSSLRTSTTGPGNSARRVSTAFDLSSRMKCCPTFAQRFFIAGVEDRIQRLPIAIRAPSILPAPRSLPRALAHGVESDSAHEAVAGRDGAPIVASVFRNHAPLRVRGRGPAWSRAFAGYTQSSECQHASELSLSRPTRWGRVARVQGDSR